MCVVLLPLPLQLGRVVLLVGCLLEVGLHPLDVLLSEAVLLLGVLGGIVGGLGDCLRTLAGGRARMMPLCGRAAAASSGWQSKVRKEEIGGCWGR